MIYKKNISIASIGILLISDIPILLSERCKGFEVQEDCQDVVMRVHIDGNSERFELEDARNILDEDTFAIYENEDGIFKVQYESEKKESIHWIAYADASCRKYEIYYREERDCLEGINPLQYVVLSEFLIHHNAVILHSSLIDVDGKGIVFTAPSQVGKSTQANLWEQYRHAEILNGDRAIIRKQVEGYIAYGSPFAGSSAIYKNRSTQLETIVVLKQAEENRVRKIGAKEAFLNLLSQISLLQGSKNSVDAHMEWLLQWMEQVPVYLLECRPDEEAVSVLWNKIEEEKHERK